MGQKLLNRVPQVTIFFWIMKIVATTLGLEAADFLNHNLNFGIMNSAFIIMALLMIALYLQFKTKRYRAGFYWLVVVLISIVGTLGSDILDVTSQIKPVILVSLVAITFLVWYLKEGTLSISSINTTKREVFYWVVIFLTFAIGKATGDWISGMLSLNYFSSVLMYAGAIGIVSIAHRDYKLNSAFAFWITYILTGPFGETFSNFLSKPFHSGGIGLGTTVTNLIFLLTMVILIIYKTKTRKKESRFAEGIYTKISHHHPPLK